MSRQHKATRFREKVYCYFCYYTNETTVRLEKEGIGGIQYTWSLGVYSHVGNKPAREIDHWATNQVGDKASVVEMIDLSHQFFLAITQPSSCLQHLIPPTTDQFVISRLGTSAKFPKVYTRTKRYCSFINYALNDYQDKI